MHLYSKLNNCEWDVLLLLFYPLLTVITIRLMLHSCAIGTIVNIWAWAQISIFERFPGASPPSVSPPSGNRPTLVAEPQLPPPKPFAGARTRPDWPAVSSQGQVASFSVGQPGAPRRHDLQAVAGTWGGWGDVITRQSALAARWIMGICLELIYTFFKQDGWVFASKCYVCLC